MNTIIEFVIYGLAALALIAVPFFLIAGGLACRSIDYSADGNRDDFAHDATARRRETSDDKCR